VGYALAGPLAVAVGAHAFLTVSAAGLHGAWSQGWDHGPFGPTIFEPRYRAETGRARYPAPWVTS
jgi:hypothetical protein